MDSRAGEDPCISTCERQAAPAPSESWSGRRGRVDCPTEPSIVWFPVVNRPERNLRALHATGNHYEAGEEVSTRPRRPDQDSRPPPNAQIVFRGNLRTPPRLPLRVRPKQLPQRPHSEPRPAGPEDRSILVGPGRSGNVQMGPVHPSGTKFFRNTAAKMAPPRGWQCSSGPPPRS